jgi:CHAT domain-containing protein/tetratricopeptide (TPR) repeat protein
MIARCCLQLSLLSPPRYAHFKAILVVMALLAAPFASWAGVFDASAPAWSAFLDGRIDLDEALAEAEADPAALLEELGADGPAAAGARRVQGALLIMAGRPTEAIEVLEAALADSAAADPVAETFLRLNLGRALVHTRQVDLAAAQLDRALAMAADIDRPLWLGDAAIARSVIDRWSMDLAGSLAHRVAALQAYRRIGYRRGEARALHYIGTIHVFEGELTMAMQVLQEALDAARAAEFDVEIAGALADLAGVNFLVGDLERARAQYAEAAALTAHPWRRGQLANNLGAMLAAEGRHDEALPRFTEALELVRKVGDRRLEAEILVAAGRSRCELKQFDAGTADLDSALVLARQWQLPMTEAYALQYRGCALLDQDRLDEAARTLGEALDQARATGFFDLQEACLWALAIVDRRRGDLDGALAGLEEALAVVGDVRRLNAASSEMQAGYFSQARRTFDELIDLLFELHQARPGQGYDAHALAVAQQAKARSLLDRLREAEVELRGQADPAVQAREQDLLARIAELEQGEGAAAALAELENELALLEADLRRADPRYAELKYPRPCTLAEAQARVIAPGELVLEYHLGEASSYLWAIGRDRFAMHRLPPAADIELGVRELLPLLRDYNVLGDDAAWYTAQAWPLSEALLGPVLPDIAESERVTVAADGLLAALPFAVLLTGPSGERDFGRLPWLVGGVEVAGTPSLSVLQRLRAVTGPADLPATVAVVIGRPRPAALQDAGVFARAAGVEALGPVPLAEQEMDAVMAAFPAGAAVRLEAGQATLESLMDATAGGAGVVHFTTHGLFNESRPLYSGLVLEPGESSDAFLAVGEIFGLRLDCRQVVLSACSSGLGRRVTGEGVTGLTRAFLYAGAANVTAALWDVAGAGAAPLMGEMYRQAAVADADPAGALAAAQRAMISGRVRRADGGAGSHPCFWGAFVVVGR